ncbi:divalent-cation tolerance protein CutA [Rhizorhapis sp.]|uniref:divalent-cation tolerance protein CutA n=1 Tax=Rhizorhapis sp. TaxID=1968842 RepID=UPI002B460F61|nr:divalent-cation tolerance protein CutA [Rhizorhapis sp.]HKR17244.1 divalent-cation tolerance protein CutA [Rhizorhapis sp.]
MNGLALVYTLFGTAEEARTVARRLVSEKLAGCANILSPCTSIYEWQGEMQEEGEVAVLLKTRPEKRAALTVRLAELHSYEVPAILSWDAGVNEAYADWIGRQAG